MSVRQDRQPPEAPDVGWTHIALPVKEIARSVRFYEEFAAMRVVHERIDQDTGSHVVWLSDGTRPFVLVLIESERIDHVLGGVYCHLGVACSSRAQVDDSCARARSLGMRVLGPQDSGPPVGYWAYITDPDGHNLELSYGQEVGATLRSRAKG